MRLLPSVYLKAKILGTTILKSICERLPLFLISERLILFPKPYSLKEFRNSILRIIRVRSLFCLMPVYAVFILWLFFSRFVTDFLRFRYILIYAVGFYDQQYQMSSVSLQIYHNQSYLHLEFTKYSQ